VLGVSGLVQQMIDRFSQRPSKSYGTASKHFIRKSDQPLTNGSTVTTELTSTTTNVTCAAQNLKRSLVPVSSVPSVVTEKAHDLTEVCVMLHGRTSFTAVNLNSVATSQQTSSNVTSNGCSQTESRKCVVKSRLFIAPVNDQHSNSSTPKEIMQGKTVISTDAEPGKFSQSENVEKDLHDIHIIRNGHSNQQPVHSSSTIHLFKSNVQTNSNQNSAPTKQLCKKSSVDLNLNNIENADFTKLNGNSIHERSCNGTKDSVDVTLCETSTEMKPDLSCTKMSSLPTLRSSSIHNSDIGRDQWPGDGGQTNTTSEFTDKNGEYFLHLVAVEAERLNGRSSSVEQYLREELSEAVCGRLRAAVGKANLLTSQKFLQFRELCQKNLTESDEVQFRTTCEDLAGFWDVVLIQVNDVDRMFDEITLLSQCDWDESKLSTMNGSTNASDNLNNTDFEITKNSPSTNKASKQSMKTPVKSSKTPNSSHSVKKEEAKKRLMAAKLAGRQRKASNSEDEIQIFVS